jgi:septal ring factor EnvC (AmiA/AmiB activator)
MCRRLLALAFAAWAAAAGAADARERWLPPVPGPPLRGFAYDGERPFAAGLHRGADLAVERGEPVRSACAGPVAFAGRVGRQGGVVSVRCGAWRVSYVGLADVGVRAGALVAAGRRLGVAGRARGHAGLHLGVRREGRRFGYVDPLAFLAGSGHASRRPPARRRRPPQWPRGQCGSAWVSSLQAWGERVP